jgi:hypothetical protein
MPLKKLPYKQLQHLIEIHLNLKENPETTRRLLSFGKDKVIVKYYEARNLRRSKLIATFFEAQRKWQPRSGGFAKSPEGIPSGKCWRNLPRAWLRQKYVSSRLN